MRVAWKAGVIGDVEVVYTRTSAPAGADVNNNERASVRAVSWSWASKEDLPMYAARSAILLQGIRSHTTYDEIYYTICSRYESGDEYIRIEVKSTCMT